MKLRLFSALLHSLSSQDAIKKKNSRYLEIQCGKLVTQMLDEQNAEN
jgi:hypothetical protein